MTVRIVIDASVAIAPGALSTAFEISDEAELANVLERAREWCQAEVRRQNRRQRFPDRAEIEVTRRRDGRGERVLFQTGQVLNMQGAEGERIRWIRWSEPIDPTGWPLAKPRPASPREHADHLGLPLGWEARGLDGPRPEAHYRRPLRSPGESKVFAPDIVASFFWPGDEREPIKWGVYSPSHGGQIAYGTADSPVEAAEETLRLVDRFEELYRVTGDLARAVAAFRAEVHLRQPARVARRSW